VCTQSPASEREMTLLLSAKSDHILMKTKGKQDKSEPNLKTCM